MKPDQWQEIERLYHSVLEREASRRAAFLEEACRGDEALRREVESLLAQQSEAAQFIETPAAQMLAQGPSLLGRQIGSYKILSLLGAGGMGEVYLAHDDRLGRKIALKLLPAQFTQDEERVRRLEREARTASALNHPNIVTIYEMGQANSLLYVAMELVEGKTLREMLIQGALPTRQILQIGVQVADGLAKAHAAGIVHRDLKPENLMITKEGLVKILDFGLAKLTPMEGKEQGSQTLVAVATEPGVILGTVGYMSPEQASAHEVDFRSDQFSLGAILYEMATGKRAFQRETAVETLSAIVREEPEALAAVNPKVPAPLRWAVERCLAKSPEDRYASTRDLAREIQSLRDHVSELGGAGATMPLVSTPPAQARRSRVIGAISLAAILLALFSLISFYAGRDVAKKQLPLPSVPTFHRLTFRHGHVTGARFAADGQTVVYGATFGEKPSELYTTRPESPESRSLGLADAGIFSISPSGEMAVALGCILNWGGCIGTLAQVPLGGGAPRELLPRVLDADWDSDGKALAVVRLEGSQCRLEYPIGKVLYETSGWIQGVRVSPKRDLIAFIDSPILKAMSGSVCVVDLAGKRRTLSGVWKGVSGLAWSPAGDEIWFTGTKAGNSLALRAVTLSGRERMILESPSTLGLSDISRDGGRVLLVRGSPRAALVSLTPGATKERDLGWFDYSTAADLSADGKTLLFYEFGEAARGTHVVYLRKTDGSDPVRLGEGKPLALSPDGKWALAVQQTLPPQLVLLPTGPGQQKSLPRGAMSEYKSARWFPDSTQIFFEGTEAGHRPRTYVQDINGGEPRPVTAEGIEGVLISPDGKLIAAMDRYGENYLCPVDGGELRTIEGYEEGDSLLQWSADSRSLFLRGTGDSVLRIYKLDLASGRRELWKELRPPDLMGLIGIGDSVGETRLTPDGRFYVYTSWTYPSELYLAEGLK